VEVYMAQRTGSGPDHWVAPCGGEHDRKDNLESLGDNRRVLSRFQENRIGLMGIGSEPHFNTYEVELEGRNWSSIAAQHNE